MPPRLLPSTAQAAPEVASSQPDPLTTLAQTDADFSAWFARWKAKNAEARAQYDALGDQINPMITVRHFPGIAPALRAVGGAPVGELPGRQ